MLHISVSKTLGTGNSTTLIKLLNLLACFGQLRVWNFKSSCQLFLKLCFHFSHVSCEWFLKLHFNLSYLSGNNV